MPIAGAVKSALQDYIESDMCGLGDVCPHVHNYLLLKGGVAAALIGGVRCARRSNPNNDCVTLASRRDGATARYCR